MLSIQPFRKEDLNAILAFTDKEIGDGYYSKKELEEIFAKSQLKDTMCSFQLVSQEGAVKGVRISYPPGNWSHGKGKGLHPEKWPHPLKETAYFQSLFLAADVQGEGWGGKMSQVALQTLKKTGAKGVVCHSWKESPHNSSHRYLQKLGFELVAEHPLYWKEIDYNCTRCKKPPCLCTAQEMYLDLQGDT